MECGEEQSQHATVEMFRSLHDGQTPTLEKLAGIEPRQQKLEGNVALLKTRMVSVEGKKG